MRIILYMAILLLNASLVISQPTVNSTLNQFTSFADGDVTTMTISSVIVSGSNRGLAVCAYEQSVGDLTGVTISTVAFNTSESLTKIVENSTADFKAELWYLSNPTATTADIVVTLSGSPGAGSLIIGSAIPLSDAKQSAPVAFNDANCGGCSIETVDVTTTVANTLLLTCARHNIATVTWSHGAGQTEVTDFGTTAGSGESISASYEVKLVSGLETLESSATSSGTMRLVAMGIEPAPPAVGATRRRQPVIRWR